MVFTAEGSQAPAQAKEGSYRPERRRSSFGDGPSHQQEAGRPDGRGDSAGPRGRQERDGRGDGHPPRPTGRSKDAQHLSEVQ